MLYGKLAFHMTTCIMRGGSPWTTAWKNCGRNGASEQEDLARELGVSRQTISSLEKGRYNPSILLAFKIARRFEMRIEDVFIYQEEDHEE